MYTIFVIVFRGVREIAARASCVILIKNTAKYILPRPAIFVFVGIFQCTAFGVGAVQTFTAGKHRNSNINHYNEFRLRRAAGVTYSQSFPRLC